MEVEEQHPIPQQISAYQFRLVGDMTIKQFFQVAGGALIALLIYSSNFASYIKWPLIIISFLTGIAFAFFPLQDRPLSTWIILFIKSIYSPTLYVWKKTEKRRDYFLPEVGGGVTQTSLPQVVTAPEVQITQQVRKEQIQTSPEFTKLEKKEQEFLSTVTKHFTSIETIIPKPVTSQHPTRMAKDVAVPQSPKISLSDKEKEHTQVFQYKPTSSPSTSGIITITPFATKKSSGAQIAQFSQEAAPPTPPTKANVIVGQVIDMENSIIEGAILEIRDSEGRPVRALKSNKLGHFMIVTPLLNGKYEIITDKEGYSFAPLTIDMIGEIIQPIVIRGKFEA